MCSLSRFTHDIRYTLDDEPLDISITEFIKELSSQSGCLKIFSQKHCKSKDEFIDIKNRLIKIQQQNNKIKQIKYRYPYCWIIPADSIDKILEEQLVSFEINYKIIIYNKNKLYYSTFTASYAQIQKLHQTALKYENLYFSSVPFTTVVEEVTKNHRSDELNEDMKCEQTYICLDKKLKCKGPGKSILNKTRKLTQTDMNNLANMLCKIFNSPSFAIQGFIWTILDPNSNLMKQYNHDEKQPFIKTFISKDLELLLKHKAYKKLKEWRHCLKNCQFRSYEKKPFKAIHNAKKNGQIHNNIDKNEELPNELLNSKYHSVFAVSTVISSLGGHWAVIFEGKYYILTIEYVEDFINFKFTKNNIIGQRVTWFSQCISKKDATISQEFFNKRWSTLRKSYLPNSKKIKGQVSFKYIVHIVEKWIRNSQYYVTTHNCQQFTRNIFAAFDSSEGKFLNTKLDQKNMFFVFPAMPVADVVKEEINMHKFMDDINGFNDEIKMEDKDEYEIIMKTLGKDIYVESDNDNDNDINYSLSLSHKQSLGVIKQGSISEIN
eukprot:466121_1